MGKEIVTEENDGMMSFNFSFRYLLIMPTLLKIYSNHQTNKLITTTVEYAVKQFYLMNRKPFILQMFGSVSAMLDTDEEGTYGDAHKVIGSLEFETYYTKNRKIYFRFNPVVFLTFC